MIDLYLRFTDEAEWLALGIEPDAALLVDVVGVIYRPTDEAEPVALPGYHVNVRCTDERDLLALEPFAVEVGTPTRVWA